MAQRAYRTFQRAIRDDRWKLIIYTQINRAQLFDLQADPAEMHDLAGDPKFAKELKRMNGLLTKEQKRFGDHQPLTSPTPKPEAFDFSKVKRKVVAE